MKKILFLLMLTLLVLPASSPAKAITNTTLKLEFNVDPGAVIQDSVMIVNEYQREITLVPSVENIVPAEGEEGFPNFVAEDIPTGISKWIDIDTTPRTVNVSGQYSFPFTINVPADAMPGGYYGVVCVGEYQDDANPLGAAAIQGDICSIVLINVNGDVVVKGNVLEFNAREFQSSLPVDFTTRFENQGTIYVKPVGNIIITNIFGKRVAELTFNSEGGNVLPNSVRRYEDQWLKTELDEDTSEIMKEIKNFGLGPYRAELVLSYGAQTKESALVIDTFWVIPWQLIIVGLVALLVLTGLVKLYNRSVVNSAMKNKNK